MLEWSEKHRNKPEWEPGDWRHVIDTFEQFAAGTVEGLLARAPGLLQFPEQIHWTFGPYDYGHTEDLELYGHYLSRVWAIYKDDQERVWILRSTDDYTDVEFVELTDWSPQGSRWPSIEFDGNGQMVQAVAFRPAGQGYDEVWIVTPGSSPAKVSDGEHPYLYRDPNGDLLIFYHRDEAIRYRAMSQSFNIEHTVQTATMGGVPTIKAARTWRRRQMIGDTLYDTEQPVLVYQNSEELGFYRYVMADEAQRVVVYPMQTETEDAAELSVAFGAIEWEQVALGEVLTADAAELSVAFGDIAWTEITTGTEELEDVAELSVAFGDIVWTEITTSTEELEDVAELSVAFDTILWIEVQDE